MPAATENRRRDLIFWEELENRKAAGTGFTAPAHYTWYACRWGRPDPTNPIKKWDTAWRNLRATAGLPGLRFHDLGHTIITELAEMGVPDHVIESITGHLSRRMLEHYSHVRLDAKRKALEQLDVKHEQQALEPKVALPIQEVFV